MTTTNFSDKPSIDKLVDLMTMLRDQQHGCPWDLKQTIKSLLPYTLEEAYEVADAIESGDMVELEDELGDLLFQVVFYAQIAKEAGLFNFDDVAAAITDKLIRRHPHVFPDRDVSQFGKEQNISAEQVVLNWEAIKAEEKEEKRKKGSVKAAAALAQGSNDIPQGILDDVPRALPAMERARKLQKRAAGVGFDWKDIQPVLEKLKEEIAEFEEALAAGNAEQISDELGDILFSAVNLARHSSVEPELALRSANMRFSERFAWIEAALREEGKTVQESNLDELDKLWNQAKLNK